jgi:hypothetical protein
MNKHFDGNGHITLDFAHMLELYADRRASLVILRHFPPFRYLVVPDIEIHVKKDPSGQSYLVHRYPGEIRNLEIKLNKRALEALRRLFKSGDVQWRVRRTGDETVFVHPGQVIRKVDAVDYGAASVGG